MLSVVMLNVITLSVAVNESSHMYLRRVSQGYAPGIFANIRLVCNGATILSIMTFSLMALSIITFSINELSITFK
jgi:hypothetical protein